MTDYPKLVSGFTVIPVAYPHSTHILYARAHVSKSSDTTFPEGRTLFIVNIPVDATDRELALFFKPCGTIERVVYDRRTDVDPLTSQDPTDMNDDDDDKDDDEADANKPDKSAPQIIPLPTAPLRPLHKTGSTAHIIFLDPSSLTKALVPPPKPRAWPSSEEPRGLAHYVALFDAQRPPLDVVKAHADSFMARFDFEQVKKRQTSAYRKGEAVVDEDGFTLVTRGGAYGQTLGGGVGVASKTFQKTGKTGSKKKRKESKEKESFYAFQKAEKQREALLDLKKGFEEDKARIEKLKQSRRFKPY